MFSTILITVLAATSIASARMDARSETRRSDAPSHYAEGYLERYDVYHTRYVEIGCKGQHKTPFFEKCCHPMLATETLEKNRPAECNPANIKKASSTTTKAASTPKATPNKTHVDGGDEYCYEGDEDCECEDEDDDNNNDDDECKEGDADCVCEPEDDDGDEDPKPKPSSKAPAPPKASSKAQAVASSTKKAAPAKSTPKPSGQTRTGGVATYFWQNGNAGACGKKHKDSDLIAAIDGRLYGNLGRASNHCGEKILITRTDTGKSVTVTVADACPSCINANSIDLSHGAFNAIATDAEGQVPISWQWL